MGDLNTPIPGSRLPEQFGKYSILGHLATGGMAEVYLARQGGIEGFEKLVVIKRIRPEMTDFETTAFFLDEARLVATLEHPNIAQVYEMDVVNGSYFFVMEYVHGADLRQLMETALHRKQEVTLANAVYIMIGVCTALHYAHEKCDLDGHPLEIIHRDVSPSNVLLSHDGHVKVCDFGIAKATNRTAETSRGVLKGKFSYMSPEQCRSLPLDRRSDIFSIGTLLYELSTLSRLFNAPSDYELLRQIAEEPVPRPSARKPGYPPELERIVMRALSRDPADRYPTAQAMQIELEDFAREHKLAMSSINLARLMGQLFEKRVEQWLRAQRSTGGLGEQLIENPPRASARLPVFVPVGSANAAAEPEITLTHDTQVEGQRERRRSQPMGAVSAAIAPAAVDVIPRRGRSVAWLVGAVLAGMVAGGVTITGSMIASNEARASRAALDSDAERIASALETAERNAHARADSLAITPMLRAGIETDTATLRDMFANEMGFSPARGEAVEVFTLKADKPTSLVRLPNAARPIAYVAAGGTRVELGKESTVVAAAAVTGYKTKINGVLAVREPIDLTPVSRRLEDHVTQAALEVSGSDNVPLVAGTATTDQIKIDLPANGDAVPHITLAATPKTGADVGWVVPARYAALGVAVLLLLIWVTGLRRRV